VSVPDETFLPQRRASFVASSQFFDLQPPPYLFFLSTIFRIARARRKGTSARSSALTGVARTIATRATTVAAELAKPKPAICVRKTPTARTDRAVGGRTVPRAKRGAVATARRSRRRTGRCSARNRPAESRVSATNSANRRDATNRIPKIPIAVAITISTLCTPPPKLLINRRKRDCEIPVVFSAFLLFLHRSRIFIPVYLQHDIHNNTATVLPTFASRASARAASKRTSTCATTTPTVGRAGARTGTTSPSPRSCAAPLATPLRMSTDSKCAASSPITSRAFPGPSARTGTARTGSVPSKERKHLWEASSLHV